MSWRLPPPHSSVRGKTQLVQKENYISKQAVSAGSDISLALSVHFLSTPSGGENSFLDILFILM